jgi:4-amino-4-deoxy-L-arabinose transferase-like glycosyltransferase
MTWVDEPIYIVAGIKLYLQDPNYYDPLLWNFEHPPLAKYIIGLTTILAPVDFSGIINLQPNYYAGLGIPIVAEAIDSSLTYARFMPAVFGILLSYLIYLFAKGLYDSRRALIAFFLSAISVELLTYSRLAYLDIFLITFFTATIYFFWRSTEAKDEAKRINFFFATIKLNEKLYYQILTGIFLGLAFVTKSTQPFILLISLIVLYLLFRKQLKIKYIAAMGLSAAIVFLLLVGDISLFIKGTFGYFGAGKLFTVDRVVNGIRVLLRLETGLLGLVIISLLFLYKKFDRKNYFLLVPISIIFLIYLLSSNQIHRYFAPAVPFLIIFAVNFIENNRRLYVAAPFILISLLSAIIWFPYYIVYTNVIDQMLGRSYFWENSGFIGFGEAAKYLRPIINESDIVFSSDDAIRYRLSANVVATEGGTTLLYMVDGNVFDLKTDCPNSDQLHSINVSYVVLQNPQKLTGYCDDIKKFYYSLKNVKSIDVIGVEVVRILRL